MRQRSMILGIVVMMVVMAGVVSAHAAHPAHDTFEQAEALINAKIPCTDLNEDELAAVGDFLMEQMHPGEAHERMDEMMGGENSASLRQMHINMAKSQYCNESRTGMMSMMGGMGMMMGSSGWMIFMMAAMMVIWIGIIIGVIYIVYWLLKTLFIKGSAKSVTAVKAVKKKSVKQQSSSSRQKKRKKKR